MTESASPSTATPPASAARVAARPGLSKPTIFLLAACAVSLGASGMLWVKLSHIQETLARQSADAIALSVEAKTLAKAAQDTVRETASRQNLMETKVSEVAMQRTQLEELMKSLSRSRDENLVVDIESALRLAQQQASLTGSVEPLLAALRSAEQRIARAAQPRLNPLVRAITKDIERIKGAPLADTPGLLVKLDELVRMVDTLPLANAVAQPSNNAAVKTAIANKPTGKTTDKVADKATGSASAASASAASTPADPLAPWPQWLQNVAGAVRDEARGLVRVSRIDTPEAALLSPEQSFFARENLKLKILNARLGLLARQVDSSRADLEQASSTLARYFDGNARPTQQAQAVLALLQSQVKIIELPRIDDTLAALTTAAAGR
jgi:uroporphyrin-III C-methyltransferase